MSERNGALRIAPTTTEHVIVRSDVAARIAIVRASGLKIFESRQRKKNDLAIATEDGMFILIEVLPFSTHEVGVRGVDAVPELRWSVRATDVERARRSQTPIFLFLVDAETGHGRFARLDTHPAPPSGAKTVRVSFPAANLITPESITRIIAELRDARQSSAA